MTVQLFRSHHPLRQRRPIAGMRPQHLKLKKNRKKTEGERGRRAAARVALVYAPPQGCIVVLFAEVILAEVNPILYVAIGPGHQLVIAARKVSHVGSVALMSFSARHLLLLSGAFGLQIGVRIVSRAF